MKDEIKEILDKWKCYIELTKKFTTNEYEMLRVEDINKILDYITNLQEENEYSDYCNKKLREKITNLEYKITTLEDYKTRNEKAIKYIKSTQLYGMRSGKTLYSKVMKEVINILQGSDE